MQATEEQAAAITAAAAGRSIALEAMAGTGKSTTLKMIAQALPAHRKVLLTAFSAQVIRDAKDAGYPPNVRPQGNHSLAYSPVGSRYRDRGRMARRLTPRAIVDVLGISEGSLPAEMSAWEGAHMALDAVLRFQQSADRDLAMGHVRVPGAFDHETDEVEDVIFRLAQRVWSNLCDLDRKLPITHDTYLKLWALSDPRLPFDTVMVDETQDANAVIIDLLTRQNAQMIVVGDPRQQIFSFRGAINAMSRFKVDERLALTQSFRFGPIIAQAANAVLLAHAKSRQTVRGFDRISDGIGPFSVKGGRCTVIARTNAALMAYLIDTPGRIGVVGGVSELLWLVKGAESLQGGRRALQCPDLADFASWQQLRAYAESPAGRDLSVLVKLVEEYGAARLQQMLRSVEGNEANEKVCDLLLTTAHRAKGREWDRVILANDFPVPTDDDLAGRSSRKKAKWTPEEANLLYVATTRARKELNVLNHDAWGDAFDRILAKNIELPGLTDDPVLLGEDLLDSDLEVPRSVLVMDRPLGLSSLMEELLEALQTGEIDAHAHQSATYLKELLEEMLTAINRGEHNPALVRRALHFFGQYAKQ